MTARILIVEDEEALTLLLRYNLESEGYAVEASGRGDEAELRLKENTPDLAVIDWMLPGLSGIELIRRLRARPETQRLPVIMLTARGEEGERVRGLATGADDYIVKPFSVPELLARIGALLRRAKPERVAATLSTGDIELDRNTKRVSRSGRCSSIPAASSRASSFWIRCGDATSTSTNAPSTSMSAACARRSTAAACRIRSAPCAAPATRWTTASARWREFVAAVARMEQSEIRATLLGNAPQ